MNVTLEIQENIATVVAPAFTIAGETLEHVLAREALLDRAMGEGRRRKSSEKLRRGRLPAEGLAFSAVGDDGLLAGTVRLWDVHAGLDAFGFPVSALLLGPLAVDPCYAGCGIGSALMRRAIDEAGRRAMVQSCSSVIRNITSASALPLKRPANLPCPALMRSGAFWRWS